MTYYAPLSLRGRYKEVYISFVKDKFDSHFIKRRNVIFERAKFNMRKQEDGESVDGFITALNELVDTVTMVHCVKK